MNKRIKKKETLLEKLYEKYNLKFNNEQVDDKFTMFKIRCLLFWNDLLGHMFKLPVYTLRLRRGWLYEATFTSTKSFIIYGSNCVRRVKKKDCTEHWVIDTFIVGGETLPDRLGKTTMPYYHKFVPVKNCKSRYEALKELSRVCKSFKK